jgi:hypothetical protein
MVSNVIGITRRGTEWARQGCGRENVLRYLNRAIGAEEPNSPRRRELLLQRVSVLPQFESRRLRACACCDRPYLGPCKAPRRDLLQFCPGCRHLAHSTAPGLHRKAIKNAQRGFYKHRRIRRALGDRHPTKPEHCQHGSCTNNARLWLVWTSPAREPLWLCWRHKYYALKNRPLARPRPRGRPRKAPLRQG